MENKRKIPTRKRWAGIVALPAILLTAALALADTIRVTDMAGRRVTVTEAPGRIVCIGPGALRLIVYLEAHDRVVGVEDLEKRNPEGRPYRLAKPELGALPRIGPGGPAVINKKPDLEAVLSVHPDLVFITYMDAPLADQVQETLGIPVVVLSYGAFATFDTAVYDAIRIAGKILGREDRAHAVVDYIESLRKDLERRTLGIPADRRPGVYVGGIGYRGAQGIESTEAEYIPFNWVHANNVAGRIENRIGSHVSMDKELLLRLDPDVLFIDGGGLALVAADVTKKPVYYNNLTAFKTRRVHTLLPFNWYTTNIGTALADAYAIGKLLYSDRFADVSLDAKADEIYTFLVGSPVYAMMRGEYGELGGVAPFWD
ncbi:MAG: iron ABC transporter substrate-binding protein [Desulfobacterales bacterium]